MGRTRRSILERIYTGVALNNNCWIWKGRAGKNGYGQFGIRDNGKLILKLPHRVSYETFIGPIPKGLVIDHLCNNRMCVNPEHLEAVTQKVNVHRSNGVAALNARKTHCKHGHEFTPENTYINLKRGNRSCKECGKATYFLRLQKAG